jgi:hypothetical protein
MHLARKISFRVSFLVVTFALALPFSASAKSSADLDRAVAAAARARATPKGEAYGQAANLALRDVMASAIKDCLPINAPGMRMPPGFQAVLIIGRTGKLKWIVRNPRDPMANCFLSKTVGVAFPPPPADNWPVLFQINLKP